MNRPRPLPRLTERQRTAWLRLLRSENVGPRSFRELINRYGGAEAALAALPEMARAGGRRRAIRIATSDDIEREIEAVDRAGAILAAPGESGYPPLLTHIHDPPPLICAKGRLDLSQRRIVAIVGARNASALGRRSAALIAGDLGGSGFIVGSGLARGIDTAAHEAAVESGTIASLAGGIDNIYPPQNAALQERIGEVGLLLSEMPPAYAPVARDFPRRNRLISGMSLGIVVIEAARRSGSLITARLALEHGREVFAVPGSPLDPRAEGANRLIRDGATLTRSAADIVEVLEPMLTDLSRAPEQPEHNVPEGLAESSDFETPEPPGDDARTRIASLLSVSPVSIDDIIQQSGAGASVVAAVLLELEVAGKVLRHPGQLVCLRPEA